MIGGGLFKRKGMALSPLQRAKTVWVVGLPGSGKTFALISWSLADLEAGRGFGFLDPHEDAFDLLLRHTAARAEVDRELAEKVVVIDPFSPEWAVGINPLELLDGLPPERIAWFFTGMVIKILKIDASIATRMVWLMVHTCLALAELGLTLHELPMFLRNHEWRETVIRAHVETPEVRDYFLREFPQNERLRTEWMQSTLNKMAKFVMDPDLQLIVGQRESTINFRKLMDQRQVLLVNLSKGRLGSENSQLFGAFIVGLIQLAALSRVDDTDRPPFVLYVDEWQNFITDHVQEILSESRKYGLSMVLANQYLDQLPLEQKQAVLKTAGTLVSFHIGYQDAEELAREMFLPSMHQTRWGWRMVGRLPLLLPRRELASLGHQWERSVRSLTTLRPREFWIKHRGPTRAVKQRTLEVPEPSCSPQALDALVTLSGVRYARRKEEVRRELLVDRPRLLRELAGGPLPPTAEHDDDDEAAPSLWGA